MTIFSPVQPFTFKPPASTPVDNITTTKLHFTCKVCGRNNTYYSDNNGSKLCPCGNLVVEEQNGKLTYIYGRPTWTDEIID